MLEGMVAFVTGRAGGDPHCLVGAWSVQTMEEVKEQKTD